MVEWNDLDELLDKDIGEIREMIAREDADLTFKAFLIENGWITDGDNEYDDNDDYYDDDEVEEEDSDENIEAGSESLPSDEEEDLAISIAKDILDGKYPVSSISDLYSREFVDRVIYLVDEDFVQK